MTFELNESTQYHVVNNMTFRNGRVAAERLKMARPKLEDRKIAKIKELQALGLSYDRITFEMEDLGMKVGRGAVAKYAKEYEDAQSRGSYEKIQVLWDQRKSADLLAEQIDNLKGFVNELRQIDVFSRAGRELLLWRFESLEAEWLIAQGIMYQTSDGSLAVVLNAELEEHPSHQEWTHLNQHFSGNPIWEAISSWKTTMAKDIAARLALLDEILSSTRDATCLPVLLNSNSNSGECLDGYYIEFLYDQVFSQLLDEQVVLRRREDFYLNPDGTATLLGGPETIRGSTKQVDKAITFFIGAQTGLVRPSTAKNVQESFRKAESATRALKEQMESLAKAIEFSEQCEHCLNIVRILAK